SKNPLATCRHRWPRFQGPRYEAAVSTVSIRALMVEYLGGSPLAKKGMRPQRRSEPWSSPSNWRMTGTIWVGATLNDGGNCHSVRTRVNSRSIEEPTKAGGRSYTPHALRLGYRGNDE